MDSIAYNLKRNTLHKVIVLASAVMVAIGIFVNFVDVSGVATVALRDMPLYCPLIFGIVVLLMVFATLCDRMLFSLLGAGVGLVADAVLGLLCTDVEFVAKLIYGSKMDTAGGIINSLGNLFGVEDAAGQLFGLAEEYVDISLSAGFFLIMVGSLAGILFSILDLVKSNHEIGNRITEVVDAIPNFAENRQGLLRCVAGETVGSSIIMNNGDTIILGREPKFSNVILREDKKISRRHCSITYRNGKFYIIDYSRNGVRLENGEKIEKNKEIALGSQSNIYLTEATEFAVQVKPN